MKEVNGDEKERLSIGSTRRPEEEGNFGNVWKEELEERCLRLKFFRYRAASRGKAAVGVGHLKALKLFRRGECWGKTS